MSAPVSERYVDWEELAKLDEPKPEPPAPDSLPKLSQDIFNLENDPGR